MGRLRVDLLAPEERSKRWSAFVSEIFFPLSAELSTPECFRGTVDNWELGEVSLSRFDSGPVAYSREKHHLRGRSDDNVLVTFATAADARFSQGNCDCIAARMDFSSSAGTCHTCSHMTSQTSSGFLRSRRPC